MADFTFLSLLLSGDLSPYCLEEAGCWGRSYKDDVREVRNQFLWVWSTDHWNQNNLRVCYKLHISGSGPRPPESRLFVKGAQDSMFLTTPR